MNYYIRAPRRRALAFALIPVALVVCTDARGQVFFYYGDHLGSSNLMTDRSGKVLHQFAYEAYGAQRYDGRTTKALS